MRTLSALIFAAIAALAAGSAGKAPRERDVDARSSVASSADVERALDGVVLLVGQRPDGRTSYGAGFVVGDHGDVLTAAHVVRDVTAIGALLRDRAQPGYTVLDGGLARVLDERAPEVVAGRVIAIDEETDLAVLCIAANTRALPRLALRADAPSLGDRVFALGHPGENVWSISSGVVSGHPRGSIQHDAALGEGSSGGPLLDVNGRVVGITTARVTAGAERVGYARPIDSARALLAGPGCAAGEP